MPLSNHQKQFLKEHGLVAEVEQSVQDSYFGIISKISKENARKKVTDIQQGNEFSLFYCAFQPEYLRQNQSTSYEPNEILKECLENSLQRRTSPCRRDLYATAELLQQAIHLFHIRTDIDDVLTREVFLPSFGNFTPDTDRIIRILVLPVDGGNLFYRLKRSSRHENRTREVCTNQCDCNKFHAKLVASSVRRTRVPSCDDLIADHWVHDPPTARESSFYRCLSKAIYGDERLFPLIRNLIVKFEQRDDFLPVFQTFIKQTKRNCSADVNTRTKNHFKWLIDGSSCPSTGELFAASSLFCTDVYIWTECDKTWSVYHPLLLPTRPRHHFLTMAKDNDGMFTLLVPATVSCNCKLERPPVKSLKDERRQLESVAWGKTAFKACCREERHGPHTHLRFLASPSESLRQDLGARGQSAARLSSSDTGYVEELLKLTGRRLEGGRDDAGTFQQCIYKEIYGTGEMVTTQFPVPRGNPDDEQIRSTANWLQRSIYILTRDRQNDTLKWKAFLPTQESRTCRYYVTLYQDPETNLYNRVVPINGCNCSMFPPVEVRYPKDDGGRRKIEKGRRHNAMREYFLDKNINENMFTDENIYPAEGMDPPICSMQSDIYHAQQRNDMAGRMIDNMDGKTTLSACLSKEIFGNSDKDNLIVNLLLTEIHENKKTYSVLFAGSGQADEQAASLTSLQGFGDIELLVAATFFQTRILVLLVEPDGTSRWKEFTQMRRKQKPPKLPRLQSTCLKDGTTDNYSVTLLRSAYGEFFRIVPETNVCNCQMEPIHAPSETNGSLRDGQTTSVGGLGVFATEILEIWAEKRKEAILTRRSLDCELGKVYCEVRNLYGIVAFQLDIHEAIIQIFERRHKTANIATIAGSAVSVLGTGILVGGAVLATGGTFVPAAAMITSLLGAAGATGGTLIEGVLSAKDLTNVMKIQNLLKVTSENTVASVRELQKKIRIDGEFRDEREILEHVQHGTVDVFGNFRFTSLVCLLEETCQSISTLLSRLALKTSAVILGRALAGFSVLLDGILIAMAARSLNQGSQTETSRTLQKNVYQLRALKSILRSYIHKADQ